MIVGVPREIKDNESRVGMRPVGVEALTRAGHKVLVERGAGVSSALPDEDYEKAGAEIVPGPREVYGRADMVVKVKEPLPPELPLIRPGQIIFTYFHFASSRELTEAMIKSRAACVAYETIEDRQGRLPLLTPMSEVAGRMAIQEGAKYLERPMMGRGILLGGVPGVEPATVVILGGGTVGSQAAKVAAGLGARVVVLEASLDRLRYLDDVLPKNVTLLYSDAFAIRRWVREADLLIGAILIKGAKAPWLVTREDVRAMKQGAVIVDVCIDQGGCIETSRPTKHSDPVYVEEGVVHYCVTNMPGAVGRTSTFALTNVSLPYVIKLAASGLKALREDRGFMAGLNVAFGEVCYPAVAEAFGLPWTPAEAILDRYCK
ncbi:MAG: alanine dehydrogenase [Planctomycetota bacterium]|nr:alanine dehydrogenase [Planctomycetota bacterium]